jgi:MarR family 2-MHQ and catechol resistance regulon transcriptional repressor
MRKRALDREISRRFAYYRRHYPDFDPLAQRLFLSLLRATMILKTALARQMRTYGITPPAFGIMSLLETVRAGGLRMQEIGKRTWVTPANVTGVVDTLEKKGLVARTRHPRDRRVILVGLTVKGRRHLGRILPRHFGFIRRLFAQLPGAEKETLLGLLTRFSEGEGK